MDFSSLNIPDLSQKAVLVTGASTGIGAAVAKAFAAQGAKVALHYNASAEAANALADDIRSTGGTAELVKADFSKSNEVIRAVEEAASALGGLDGLINNAGAMVRRVAYEDATDDDYDAIMDLNARSVVMASKAAVPHMKENGGFIINTTSIAARNGASAGAGLYGSSKAFVSNVTRGMAKELIRYGIRVNAVAPGVITTPFQERYALPGQLESVVDTIPQGRLGVADDCVGAYLFLASPLLSGYILGQVIEVNGGQLMP